MKKLKILTAMLVVLTIVLATVACVTDPNLTSITLKEGTLATQVVQDGVLDTSRVVVVAHYDDGSTKDITVSDSNLTVGSISTSEVGEQTLTITYMEQKLEVTVTVTAKPDPNASIEIVSVEMPSFIRDYKANIAEKTNKQEEFVNRQNGYFVGDDNEFIFKPVVTAENSRGVPVDVNESLLDMELQVEVMEEDEYAVKNEEDYLTINGYGNISFKSSAIDKQIKLTVKPFIKGYPENATRTVSVEFTVVDGWNAYSVADLAMIEYDRTLYGENGEDQEEIDRAQAWNNYKTDHNLPTNVKTNAVILHDDMTVTKLDIPSIFFYTDGDEDLSSSDEDYARTRDSLRDNLDIYFRTLLPGETFEIIGNYFTVDVESIPYVTRENGDVTEVGAVISHATLIKIKGENGQIQNGQDMGKASISNMYLKGNSQRTEKPEASGGLIFHKVGDVDFTIQNIIARKCFISFFCEEGNVLSTKYRVKDCKAYDNFNSFLYVWGVDDVSIDNSEMIGAGGPVMIVDHVDPTSEDGGAPSNVVVTNSTLESVVSGTEGWFTLVGATTQILTLKGADALFRSYGRTFLRNANGGTDITSDGATYINLVCVIKSGEAEGLSFDPIKGNVTIDDNAPLNFGDGEDPASMLAKVHLAGLATTGAAVFQSSAGGVGFTDGNPPMKRINATNGQPEGIMDPTDLLFQGDYINFYFSNPGSGGYMAAMLGYYPLTQA